MKPMGAFPGDCYKCSERGHIAALCPTSGMDTDEAPVVIEA